MTIYIILAIASLIGIFAIYKVLKRNKSTLNKEVAYSSFSKNKYKSADVDRYRGLFLQVGFTVSAALVFMAFQMNITPPEMKVTIDPIELDDVVFVSMHTETPPPPIEPIIPEPVMPKPTPPPPSPTVIINQVPDPVPVAVAPTPVIPEPVPTIPIASTNVVVTPPAPVAPPKPPVPPKPTGPVEISAVDIMPEFPGGPAEMARHIKRHFEISDCMREIHPEGGTVFVEFVVEVDGSIKQAKSLRDLGCGSGKRAAKMAEKMPNWNPAKIDDQAVAVRVRLPIRISVDY